MLVEKRGLVERVPFPLFTWPLAQILELEVGSALEFQPRFPDSQLPLGGGF